LIAGKLLIDETGFNPHMTWPYRIRHQRSDLKLNSQTPSTTGFIMLLATNKGQLGVFKSLRHLPETKTHR